ncbi:MAG: UvrD-helicase domain-containing protein, partial [Anaerolineae bacterium]|nr:UvrD-helicase domain-containing protein [Anaerolineae bacterium]
MMNLTPQQRRAITEHDKNLIVVAGAGSGKTRVLVERYLHLLDAHTDWPLNALVAITFTRKAAQEMRDRVRQALEARYQSAPTSDQQQIWSVRLAGMDSARIDT